MTTEPYVVLAPCAPLEPSDAIGRMLVIGVVLASLLYAWWQRRPLGLSR